MSQPDASHALEKPRVKVTSDGSYFVNDSLSNVVSGLGTARDKLSHNTFRYNTPDRLDFSELEAAYATNWIARDVIDIPVNDATREWRTFSCEDASAIQAEEKRLNVSGVVQEAFKWAGLYGGAVIVMIIDGQPLDEPLDVERVKQGALKRLVVLDRIYAAGVDYNYLDPTRSDFMLPGAYQLYGGSTKVHASNVIRIPGEKLPQRLRQANGGWDDSRLRKCFEDIKDAVSAKGGIAALIQEANVDVIQRNGLANELSTDYGTDEVLKRYQNAGMLKSMVQMLLLDGSEEYQRVAASFSGLGEILHALMEWVSGAAGIPMTRFFGVQSKGIGDSGEGDLKNYYNDIKGNQESDYRPALEQLDAVLVRSALGKIPENCEFEFNPLSQPSSNEVAQQELAFAQADDIRLQQGVALSLVLQKLQADGTYAITDDQIEKQKKIEAEPLDDDFNEEDFDPDADPA